MASKAATWKNASTSSTTSNQDRWSKTYVSSDSPSQLTSTSNKHVESRTVPTLSENTNATVSASSSGSSIRRFPRPLSSPAPPKSLKVGVSDHILFATSQAPRPPSPLKKSTTFSDIENDILPSPSPHDPTLSKVYGSLLQPKDTLPLHSCAHCSTVFPPDATIYPHPDSSKVNSFVCRPCFTIVGGSKGNCPACSRPVLTLKAEGGFIHSGNQYWHKRCYNCASCFKNIGDAPMVDLFGRPSCVDCFDNCLKREPTTPKKERVSNHNSPISSNPGGLNSSQLGKKSRESSPTIEELEQRLGIVKSRESSPAISDSGRLRSNSLTIRQLPYSGSPKSRSLRDSDSQTSIHSYPSTSSGSSSSTSLRSPKASPVRASSVYRDSSLPRAARQQPNTSENTTSPSPSSAIGYSLAPKHNPSNIKELSNGGSNFGRSSIKEIRSPPVAVNSASRCVKCGNPILNLRQGGQYVTIPGVDENAVPQIYHPDCFRCAVCDKPLNDVKKGSTSFVRNDSGPCHTQCAPPQHFIVQKISPKSLSDAMESSKPLAQFPPPSKASVNNAKPSQSASQRTYNIPLGSSTKSALPRFGGQNVCPGCQKTVALMERGVVPGPQGTRWHASCLVCGGKREVTRTYLLGRSREDKKDVPGCGKKLDSAARTDGEGGVWCRECLLLLGYGGSPLASPVRSPPLTSTTSGPSKIVPQLTGTTTIARQFTGAGTADVIARQLTGGPLTPTRSISPTKQLGRSGSIRPRPKSVIGMRSSSSIEEGRGMYLVRQLTGSTVNGLGV
ncbi:hypothetical protein CPC08DRAFT_701595 [Agrocybe pediades]|nr:hypothetical protein CPC08DRAFT_701595 [Agrocybe pediades]